MKEYSKFLCDQDCNNCEAIENKQVAVLLNALALVFGEKVWWMANSVCPNLTCCPNCHIDDFCHWSDDDIGIRSIDRIEQEGGLFCDIAERAIEVAREFRNISTKEP